MDVLCFQGEAVHSGSVVAKFILTGAEQDAAAGMEAAAFGDVLFTDDQLSGYRSIVHKTYFVLAHVVSSIYKLLLKLQSVESLEPRV